MRKTVVNGVAESATRDCNRDSRLISLNLNPFLPRCELRSKLHSMKSPMTIGRKLFLSFGAAMALTFAVSFVAWYGFSRASAEIDRLTRIDARELYLAGEINATVTNVVSIQRGMMYRSYLKDYATVEKYKSEQLENFAKLKKNVDEFTTLADTTEGRRLIGQIHEGQANLMPLNLELTALLDKHELEAASTLVSDKVLPVSKGMNANGEALLVTINDLMVKARESVESSVARSRWMTMIALGLALIVGGIIIYTVRQINGRLRQTVTELSDGADQVASAASQISSASQSLAQGASEQAASLEETSASTEEINSMARKNTENALSAAGLVTRSQEQFTETDRSLGETVEAMGEINAQSTKISKIIKVIDEIAFQTNILALNAAVEAARAGEAGMGFAVVADEVRNLAQRCAQAAKDTADLIEESINKSNGGKTKVDAVAIAIHGITEESLKVKVLVDEVNVGSQEQARGIEQIGKAIAEMDQVTQRTAASAEETASASEELTAQSESLKELVNGLSAMVGGGEARRRPQARTQRNTRVQKAQGAAHAGSRESHSGLTALHSAVGRSVSPSASEKVGAGVRNESNEFPLDDFKEF